MTCPLITKVDGTKFGKTEEGNVWLDKDKTSPYKFYQYWLNSSDEDSKKYIKIFTFESKEFIEELIDQHLKAPHERILQKFIASELTKMVHSEKDLEKVLNASNILFSKIKTQVFLILMKKPLLKFLREFQLIQLLMKNIISVLQLKNF